MAETEELRCFVGGLSWKTTDRDLEDAFQRFGRIVEAKVVIDRENGRPKGFGFVTFADESDMQDAIEKMHGKELDGRSITVNKAELRSRGGGSAGGSRGYSHGDGSDYRRSSGRSTGGNECFKCGQSGHWARECPSEGGGGKGGRYSSSSYSNSRSDRSGGDRGGNYGESRYGSSDSYGKPGGGGSYREGGRSSRSGPYDRPSGNGSRATRDKDY